eukprot:scaffold5444_cov157-Amphora_coffeaeformis.AAC.7
MNEFVLFPRRRAHSQRLMVNTKPRDPEENVEWARFQRTLSGGKGGLSYSKSIVFTLPGRLKDNSRSSHHNVLWNVVR